MSELKQSREKDSKKIPPEPKPPENIRIKMGHPPPMREIIRDTSDK